MQRASVIVALCLLGRLLVVARHSPPKRQGQGPAYRVKGLPQGITDLSLVAREPPIRLRNGKQAEIEVDANTTGDKICTSATTFQAR